MSESKHTPGPWTVVEGYHVLGVHPMIGTGAEQRPGAHFIASFKQPKSGARRGESPRWFEYSAETRANARLIAAAPDLLRELRTSPCPGGGYTGQPEGEERTVENCLKAGVCGCSPGKAVAKAEDSR